MFLLFQGLSKDDETHSTSSIQKTSQCLPMSRKTDRTLMKKFSCAKLQASKNSILQETSSSDSSDESHDDQVSEDEDHDRLTLVRSRAKSTLHSLGQCLLNMFTTFYEIVQALLFKVNYINCCFFLFGEM